MIDLREYRAGTAEYTQAAEALAAAGEICPGWDCPGCAHCTAEIRHDFVGPSVDSRAGGVTSNQYGTFANHDASEAQVRFIAKLRVAKGVVAPADERLTKKAASRLIEKLLELPDTVANIAPATPAAEVESWLKLLGRKVEPDDVTDELVSAATEWAKAWTGTFEFMVDMHNRAVRGPLSPGQAKGVLNCWRADLNRRPSTVDAGGFAKVTEDGMYLSPEGDVFKVQIAKQGSGNLYAKRLVIDPTNTGHPGKFQYEAGLINKIDPAWKMTLEQAKEFGKLYGICCNCGADLTDEKSIEAGIGPVCATKF